MMDFGGSWENHLPLVEFTYNSSYQDSIQMQTFEAFYRRPCRLTLCWAEVGKSSAAGPDIVRDTFEKIKIIRKRLVTAQSCQKYYANYNR